MLTHFLAGWRQSHDEIATAEQFAFPSRRVTSRHFPVRRLMSIPVDGQPHP
jgi:hypothetical protein